MQATVSADANPWYKGPEDDELLNECARLGFAALSTIRETAAQKFLEEASDPTQYLERWIRATSGQSLDSLDSLVTRMSSMCNVQTGLMERLVGAQSSTKKGELHEVGCYEILSSNFPDAVIEYTARAARAGDMKIVLPGGPVILIDTKAYASTVPTKEINKLADDVKRSSSDYGILVSYGSSIAGHHRFQFSEQENLFFLPSLSEGSLAPVFAILFLRMHYDAKKKQLPPCEAQDHSREKEILTKKVTKTRECVTMALADMRRQEKQLSSALSGIMSSIVALETQLTLIDDPAE